MGIKDRKNFLDQKNAGVYSWRELVEIQRQFEPVEHDALASLKQMAVAWNMAVDKMDQRDQFQDDGINLTMDSTGHIIIYKAV